MRPHEVRELIKLKPPAWHRDTRLLDRCKTIEDFRRLSRRRLPRPVYDYIAGGADEEITLRANAEAFRKWRFTPSVLADVSSAHLSTSLFGRTSAAPMGFAPTGYTRMLSPLGEPAVAAAAARAGIPYVLSTMASTSLEDLADHPAAHDADRWFQLYIWKDRDLTDELVRRADAAGYRVLEIAVDTAVSGYRVRDVRNGLTIPPQLTLKGMIDLGVRPGYWTRMLASPKIEFANVSSAGGGGYTIENITAQFDPSVDWADVRRIREQWPGRLVLKGPVGPQDAQRAKEIGLDGVHLSNHGGRQLDRCIVPIDLVQPVRRAVGADFGIVVDSGVRHGADIATALALGADAAFVGRPYLWGLTAAGEPGVDRVARLLTEQLRRTMQLIGVASVDELRKRGPELITAAH
ncbi:alpha-hydroxy-acid oxidizing protein [Nocardia sp. CA2R105]|uniref:alpha-hydroxy acid oxidase n=1 Tax=Nocardia coffeae TaxID=2873381 RepID=UPI001CA743E6|nr:alpha-hydroxy acid oxidase [Nocardia coffeae]MBY8857218.1 alpha-hydroxy-acid oxidizing protein [Nocardia coffeae]